MGAESQLLSARSVRWLDMGVVAWIVVWVVLGVLVWSDIGAQAQLGADVMKWAPRSRTPARRWAWWADFRSWAARSATSPRIETMGAEVETSGQDSRGAIERGGRWPRRWHPAGRARPARLRAVAAALAAARGSDRGGASGRRARPGVRAVPGAPGGARAAGTASGPSRPIHGATSGAAECRALADANSSVWACTGPDTWTASASSARATKRGRGASRAPLRRGLVRFRIGCCPMGSPSRQTARRIGRGVPPGRW